MKSVDYLQCNSDHTLFIKQKEGKITTLIVYVDIMVYTGNDPKKWINYNNSQQPCLK